MENLESIAKQGEELLTLASEIALQAKTRLKFELKADCSIVTNADLDVETFLREKLPAITPHASYWGEEFGYDSPGSQELWVIDPIDGTTNFYNGQPLWGITYCYIKDGECLAGFTALPELGYSLVGIKGGGVMCNGKPLDPIPTGDILNHQLVGHCDSRASLQAISPGRMRHIGAFCVEISFVAMQYLRAMTTGRVMLYDCAAGVLMCQELGADVRLINGDPWETSDWLKGNRCEPFYVGPRESNFPFPTE